MDVLPPWRITPSSSKPIQMAETKYEGEIWKHTFSFWQIGCFCILYFSVTLWTHITHNNRVFGVVGGLFLLQEIYSIKLPGRVFLGEGKAENQNLAIIFTRGDALQKIDMNQVHFPRFLYTFLSTPPTMFLIKKKRRKKIGVLRWVFCLFFYLFSVKDNYLEETLKMRNLLEEFDSKKHGLRSPNILGVREHVFTGR